MYTIWQSCTLVLTGLSNLFWLVYLGNWVTTISDFSPLNSPILPLVQRKQVHQLRTATHTAPYSGIQYSGGYCIIFQNFFDRSLPKCLGGGCRISWRAKEQICWVMSNLVSVGSTRFESRWHQNDGQWTDARLRHKISCKGVNKKLWNICNTVENWITNARKQDT